MDRTTAKLIRSGNIGVAPTDTIYGIIGLSSSQKAVERIYKIKKRDRKKPFIILIGSLGDLKLFGINIGPDIKKELKKFWPGPVSVILPCEKEKFKYLHRGTKKLAFRLPSDSRLRDLLRRTGPLVAPSANPEGKKPAENLKQAQKYFGNEVDFYIDGGEIESNPSTLLEIKKEKIIILRK